MAANPKIIPVILCGGAGERLWPMSNAKKPKAFLPLLDDSTLLQQTIKRATQDLPVRDAVIVTLAQWETEAKRQIGKLKSDAQFHYLLEPAGKGTLPAIALATMYIRERWPDALMWIMPCDHYFASDTNFAALLTKAISISDHGITLFGVKPTKAESAYGYMKTAETNGRYSVTEFIEKPDAEAAQSLVDAGGHYWNTAIYLAPVSVLHDRLWGYAMNIMAQLSDMNVQRPDAHSYGALSKSSFEKVILQQANQLEMVRIDTVWTDIGRWRNIWETAKKDHNGNVLQGNVLCDNVQDSLVYSQKRIVSCIGLKNTIVIDTDDTVLVAHIDSAESIRELIVQAQALKKKGQTLRYGAMPAELQNMIESSKVNGQCLKR